MKRHLELRAPFWLSVIITVASLWLHQGQKRDIASELANPLLNVIAITVGFLAAVVTYLLTADELPAIRRLRTSDAFGHLINYHWTAIQLGCLAAFTSLAVLAACKMFPATPRAVVFHFWVFMVSWALLTFSRVAYLLRRLLDPR